MPSRDMLESYAQVVVEVGLGLQPGDRVAQFQAANRAHVLSGWDGYMSEWVPWCVVGAPAPGWSRTVFPDADDADERLWGAVLRACRVDTPDPVAAWRDHSAELVARRTHLTSRDYVGLRYDGPGTDLRVGLPDGVRWNGGEAGIDGPTFIPNLPTEEVFTVPHRMQVDGRIRATTPLSYFGTLFEGFAFEVAQGAVVAATAESGQETLDRILGTDEGSVRFGEMAMVPQSSAVAAEQLVWNNMLFDENDACHIALGMSFPSCVDGADAMDADERLAAGLNHSAIHVDFVVGSSDLDVRGLRDDGSEEPIITGGEWGFTV